MLRSVMAFIASFITVVVLSVGTDAVMHAVGMFPPLGEPMKDGRLLAIALGYRLVYGVLGGYVIARLAPFSPMGHALVSGIIGFVVSTLGAIAMWGYGNHWYPIALAATAVPCAWVGGAIAALTVSRG
jgi:hypothetical protein